MTTNWQGIAEEITANGYSVNVANNPWLDGAENPPVRPWIRACRRGVTCAQIEVTPTPGDYFTQFLQSTPSDPWGGDIHRATLCHAPDGLWAFGDDHSQWLFFIDGGRLVSEVRIIFAGEYIEVTQWDASYENTTASTTTHGIEGRDDREKHAWLNSMRFAPDETYNLSIRDVLRAARDYGYCRPRISGGGVVDSDGRVFVTRCNKALPNVDAA